MSESPGARTVPTYPAHFRPAVSIVIPVYNGANYLAEAIDSALGQTYPAHEVIVVDDGSTDGGATRRIAEGYGDRVRYIHRQNGGCGAALNTGIAAMSGTYFSWLSHDDVYPPDKLVRQVEVLGDLADRETIIYGDYELIDAESRLIGRISLETIGTREQLAIPLYPLLNGVMHGCGMLVPRALFERYGCFDPTLRTSQDYALWFRFLRHVAVRYEPHVFVRSRVHDAQGSRLIPSMQDESLALWSGFIEGVTPVEATAMQGSHYRFLQHTARFLDASRMPEAAVMARTKARTILDTTLVSVVIPFRNRIPWTLEALDSARRQTHAALEIILVDDGSTDDVAPLLAAAAGDSRVRYVRQDGKGASAARNRGVAEAAGTYIAFLDSDDRWLPGKVARQLEAMESEAALWSHTSYTRDDERSGGTAAVDTSYFAGLVYPDIISFCPIATPTVMVATDVIRRNPFPENVFPGEDIITWIAIARAHPICAVPEALSVVRISADTTSSSVARSQRGIVNILSAVVAEPADAAHHREVLKLIDVARRQEIELCRLEPEPVRAVSNRRLAAARVGGARRHLVMRGLQSIRRYGLRATWQRTRLWLITRPR
jgi:glycosyltransferase involved in cell wall biosynthesis